MTTLGTRKPTREELAPIINALEKEFSKMINGPPIPPQFKIEELSTLYYNIHGLGVHEDALKLAACAYIIGTDQRRPSNY